jgi:hypothetical protein
MAGGPCGAVEVGFGLLACDGHETLSTTSSIKGPGWASKPPTGLKCMRWYGVACADNERYN